MDKEKDKEDLKDKEDSKKAEVLNLIDKESKSKSNLKSIIVNDNVQQLTEVITTAKDNYKPSIKDNFSLLEDSKSKILNNKDSIYDNLTRPDDDDHSILPTKNLVGENIILTEDEVIINENVPYVEEIIINENVPFFEEIIINENVPYDDEEIIIKEDVPSCQDDLNYPEESTLRKRVKNFEATSVYDDKLLDPDVDFRDTMVSQSADVSDEEKLCSGKNTPSLPSLIQHIWGFDSKTMDILNMPSRAIDKAEDIARLLWKSVPGLSVEKSEEIANKTWALGPGHAFEKAEELSNHLWEAVPGLPLEKAEEVINQICTKFKSKTEEFLKNTWEAGRTVIHYSHLPGWLRDNDYLVAGHRPPLNSFWSCFKSIFRIHTETGNIWTHLIGLIMFISLALYFWTRPSVEVVWEKKLVFSAFFIGAILCLCFSWLFHTVYCHSEKVGKLFGKLDYCGIAFLIVGSFIPWLYYSFYCHNSPRIIYLVLIFILGTLSIIVSMWDKFGEPQYRSLRAGVFVSLGLSGVIPAAHYILWEGFYNAWNTAAMGWLFLMAFLYILGAGIYAARFPECYWPGKFDIWFQSHQIFHVCVVIAALVHYHGMSKVAMNFMEAGTCAEF